MRTFYFMDFIKNLLDFLLHLDTFLITWVKEYGNLTYGILFLIVFIETGLVVMPLLPGDSLLFATGAICAQGALSLEVVIPLLILAALCGDNTNYFIGKYLGDFIQRKEKILFLKKEYITEAEKFYAKHGGKTIIMARFVPIMRTIAPFVAGAGEMKYSRYILFCVTGACLWVTGVSFIGYFFGNLPWVKDNFELVIFGIIGISLLPVLFQVLKAKFGKKAA